MHLRPLNYTHYAMLYPQNGGRIVAIDSVTSLRHLYIMLSNVGVDLNSELN